MQSFDFEIMMAGTVVRPVMNLYGMGAGAEVKWLTPADSTAVLA